MTPKDALKQKLASRFEMLVVQSQEIGNSIETVTEETKTVEIWFGNGVHTRKDREFE